MQFIEKDYGSELNQRNEQIERLCSQKKNLVFLNPGVVEINGVRVVGATLWSHVSENAKQAVREYMQDYELIWKMKPGSFKPCHLTVEDTNKLHSRDLRFICENVDEAKKNGQKMIVLTHHTPTFSGTSHQRYQGTITSAAFSTNLEHLLKPPIVCWMYGHTHYNNKKKVGEGVFLCSNQKGYIERNCGRFNKEFFYEHKLNQRRNTTISKPSGKTGSEFSGNQDKKKTVSSLKKKRKIEGELNGGDGRVIGHSVGKREMKRNFPSNFGKQFVKNDKEKGIERNTQFETNRSVVKIDLTNDDSE